MGTVNGGTIISFTPTPSLHAVTSRMSPHTTGCANFTFQIPSIANAAKKNNNSAERRANHNAVERARRECLNTKFQELAHALPSLAQVRRPSKSIIVQKSLDFIYDARQKEETHEKEIRSVRSENESLREEVNKLRVQLGLEPLPPREEPKASTSQQADDAKEDAKIIVNMNTTETSNEADDNPDAIPDMPETINSAKDVPIKSEEFHEEDDCSNGNTDDDYDLDTTEMIDGKMTDETSPCLYDSTSGLMYPNLLDPSLHQHASFQTEFDFSMVPSMDHMVDPTLQLQFGQHDALRVGAEVDAFCENFPLTQKFYPSPPHEATVLGYTGHISGFSMSPQDSHLVDSLH